MIFSPQGKETDAQILKTVTENDTLNGREKSLSATQRTEKGMPTRVPTLCCAQTEGIRNTQTRRRWRTRNATKCWYLRTGQEVEGMLTYFCLVKGLRNLCRISKHNLNIYIIVVWQQCAILLNVIWNTVTRNADPAAHEVTRMFI